MNRLHMVSPQTVTEGLHSVLGHAVRSTERADSPKHTGDVHHSAPGHLDEREDAQRYVDDATQIDRQHGLVILDREPVSGTRRQRDSGVVHNGPQAWRGGTATRQLTQVSNAHVHSASHSCEITAQIHSPFCPTKVLMTAAALPTLSELETSR